MKWSSSLSLCGPTIHTTPSSELHLITELNRMWRKLVLSLSSDAVIIFFTYLKVQSQFWAYCFVHFGCLIHMGPQRVWKTYTCDRIIVLKSWVYTINKKTLSHVHRLVGHLKHHQSNKLNKFVKSDLDVFSC